LAQRVAGFLAFGGLRFAEMAEGPLGGGLASDDRAHQLILARQRDVREDDRGADAGARGVGQYFPGLGAVEVGAQPDRDMSLSALGAVMNRYAA
jgi:hypothetical protein